MFINLSNHPSNLWGERQTHAACRYGCIVDIPFPSIPPEEDETYIAAVVEKYAASLSGNYSPERDVVHVMGEMCFTYALVHKLRDMGFTCVASTSERHVREMDNGFKETYFSFVRFRKYK